MLPPIITSNNPDNRKNWIIAIETTTPVFVNIRMIPDKLIADHSSIKNYLTTKLKENWSSPEKMVLNIIEELNNELIPKWIEVVYMHEGVKIEVEDRQPGVSDFEIPKN